MKNPIKGLVALGIAVGLVAVGIPLSASAHTNTVSLTCQKADVNLTSYDKGATAEVVLDGVVVQTGTFGPSYQLHQPFNNTYEAQSHSLVVTVRSADGPQYSVDFSQSVSNCYTGRTPITFNFPITTDETCTAPSGITPDFRTWTRGQNGSYEGEGFRLFATGDPTQPGDTVLTVQRIGPNGQPGYPYGTDVYINGVKASGATATLTIKPATGYQSADPALPCFDRPGVPEPEVVVSYTEWEDGDQSCETGTVITSRGQITTTTPIDIWDEATKTYLRNDAAATVVRVEESGSRPMTDAELDACAGPEPEAKITYAETDWADGQYDCLATDVEQTRTVSTISTPWDLVNHVWVPAPERATTTDAVETQRRPLTAEEIAAKDADPLCIVVTVVRDELAHAGVNIFGLNVPIEVVLGATGGGMAAGLFAIIFGYRRQRG